MLILALFIFARKSGFQNILKSQPLVLFSLAVVDCSVSLCFYVRLFSGSKRNK